MIKFKFINRDFNYRENFDCYIKVDNPIGVKDLPAGEYMIRGNKKSYRKEYFHIGNDVWYLVDDVKKDNGHYMYDSERYMLFPNLSEKEWGKIGSCYPYLSPLWKRNFIGYSNYMDLRQMVRDIKKNFIKWK